MQASEVRKACLHQNLKEGWKELSINLRKNYE